MISHQCPKCGNTLRIPDQYAGQRGSCTKCGNAITVPASSHEAPQAGIVKTSLPRASVLNKLSRTQTGCLVAFILFGAFCLIGIMNPESAEQRAEREVKQLEQRRARELRVDQGRLEREAKQRKREDQRQAEREAKQRESEQRQRKRQRDFEQRQRELRESREQRPSYGDDGAAISAVKATIEKQRNAVGTFRTAPLNGGVAVLSSREWAYWVKDGTVYAANGLAKSASPRLEYAPVGVSKSEVDQAVNGTFRTSPESTRSKTKYNGIPEPPARFTLSERKAIRAECARVSLEAQDEAERMYPISDAQGRPLRGNLEKWAELGNRLTAEAEQKLMDKYGLTRDELLAIVLESRNY